MNHLPNTLFAPAMKYVSHVDLRIVDFTGLDLNDTSISPLVEHLLTE